jgi:hypothetical protein
MRPDLAIRLADILVTDMKQDLVKDAKVDSDLARAKRVR